MGKQLPLDDLSHILQQVKIPLNKLKNARIFITGGTGFIGTWLVESLLFANTQLQLNLHLTVLTRVKRTHPVINFYTGDVRDFIFPAQKFTHIIHAGTPSSPLTHHGHPEHTYDIIVNGMKRVLEFSKVCGASELLFLSSGAVYGKHTAPVHENAPLHPDKNSDYAQGKYAAEKICLDYSKKLNIKIARCFAFVGPYLPLDQHYAIGNFIRDALTSKKIIVKNSAPVYRSYLYAADMIIWLLHILINGVANRPYNVGSGDAISIVDLAKKIAVLTDSEVILPSNFDKTKTADFYVPRVDRALHELGLRQSYTLDEAILKTILWNQILSRGA
jgi:dTDP-glucose 4,6-dehydratase